MKMKKIVSFMAAIIMLFSCMPVSAATKPTLADDLAEGSWDALHNYMASLDASEKVLIYADDTSEAVPYFKSGTLIVSNKIWDDVAAGWANDAAFAEQYELIKALDAAVVTADGTKYITEQMHNELQAAWSRIAEFHEMCESGVVSMVGNEEDAPDVSEMEQGTYWILTSDMDIFNTAMSNLGAIQEAWQMKSFGGWDMLDVEASVFSTQITSVNDAYNTVISKLHEGTKGNDTSSPSLTPVSPSLTPVESSSAWVPTLTEEEIHAQKAAETEVRQKKTVTTADGKTVKTEIAGIYEVANLNGTAVNTPKVDVQKAIGLTDEEIAAGTNASIYMSDYVVKEDREALNNAAASNGKNVLSMMISDIYSITKDGKITKLNSSKEPVSLMFGLPKHAIDANRTYSMLCVTADGRVVELKDRDNDPSTITVNTTVFGKYVIVY